MRVTVPIDVLQDTVLNQLMLAEDWKTLSSMSQTCQLLVQPSQRCLFATIFVAGPSVQHLFKLFHGSPHIAQYIYHLHYHLHDSDWDTQTGLMQWFSLLKSFELTGGYPVRNWNTIPEELRVEFIRIFSSPNLTTLTLSQFQFFPVTIFAHCHNIMRLKLHNLHINFTPRAGVKRFIRRPIPKPTILYIAQNDVFMFARLFKAKWSDTSPIMDLSSVRVLHLHYSASIPGSILHDWKPNIEILAITSESLHYI
jgi:hypothetical protein